MIPVEQVYCPLLTTPIIIVSLLAGITIVSHATTLLDFPCVLKLFGMYPPATIMEFDSQFQVHVYFLRKSIPRIAVSEMSATMKICLTCFFSIMMFKSTLRSTPTELLFRAFNFTIVDHRG